MTHDPHYRFRYPIGEFDFPAAVSDRLRLTWIQQIADFPETLKNLTENLSSEEKNLTYRPGSWKIKQIVHHCADSHINALIRFKLALTEDSPSIRPYFEERWAELTDGTSDDLTDSLQLITALHSKWARLLHGLSEEDLARVYLHPEHNREFNLLEAIGSYAWHCEHHLVHIRMALENNS